MTFEQYQAGVRASARMLCEADLYWRTNRWAEDGCAQDVSESFNFIAKMSDNVIFSTYRRTGR